jgi:WD40 repeat protein
LRGHQRFARAVAFSPDGTVLATASRNGELRLWAHATGEPREAFTSERPASRYHLGGETCVAVSPDGREAAVWWQDADVGAWDAGAGGHATYTMRGGPEGRALRYLPSGELLAAGYRSRSVNSDLVLRGLATRKVRARLSTRYSHATSVAVSADGDTVLTGGSDGIARLWWLPRTRLEALRRPVRRPAALFGGKDGFGGAGGAMTAVALSPDGALAAAGGTTDRAIRVWDTATGELLATLPGHHAAVTGLTFIPGGATLVSASFDGTARAWDIAAGALLATLVALPGDGYATFFPDGGYHADGPGDEVWWAVGLGRFAPGELDPYLPAVRAVPDGRPAPPVPGAQRTGRGRERPRVTGRS